MGKGILTVVLLAILFHPSKEVPVRLQRNPEMPLINDAANQKPLYNLLEEIVSLASPALLKNGADSGVQLRNVRNVPSDKTPDNTGNATTNDSGVEERELYDLLNKIIALILKAINHASLNKHDFPAYTFNPNDKAEAAASTTTSSPPVSSSSLPTTSSPPVSSSSLLTTVVSSTQQATTTPSAKKQREANFDLFRENAISANQDIKEELAGVDNLVEPEVKNIIARSYSDELDKTMEENELRTDTNSFLIGADSNLIESMHKEKEQGDANIQRLSENLKEEISNNEFSANPPVPKKVRNAVFEESPKLEDSLNETLNDSLSENLADPDRLYLSEKEQGESKLEDQSELDETKPSGLRNDEKPLVGGERKNRSFDSKIEERNLPPLRRVEKNARRKKSHRKSLNGEGKNGKKLDNLCESNGSGDGNDMQTFVCSFTFEINNGKSENSQPEKKKSKRLINGLRKARLRKKSKDERQVPLKEDKGTQRFLEEPTSLNSAREERPMKLSGQETPELTQNEYLNANSEETDDAQKRQQNNLSNTRFTKHTDEHDDNNNYEDENQENSETSNDHLSHKDHFRNAMKKHVSKIKDRRQNSVQFHRLNMAALRNDQEMHKSQSQPNLKEGRLSENKKRNHTEMEGDLDLSVKNELNDMNLVKSQKVELDEESGDHNRRTMEFHRNLKHGELEENMPKQLKYESLNDDADYEEGEEEEGEEDEAEELEGAHDEHSKKTSSSKKGTEEFDSSNTDYYD